ncbi:hypothetical protein HYC85_017514 [Camellia sinensis]|uniref:FCP1 homology domain-containing protein n=1 Tax=Camellia sinensis TaxID=4442 RepID=A0A7J7GSL5_CAMSI|nr:hypothetical protein HYC85_017514 [Camellia sinensis]
MTYYSNIIISLHNTVRPRFLRSRASPPSWSPPSTAAIAASSKSSQNSPESAPQPRTRTKTKTKTPKNRATTSSTKSPPFTTTSSTPPADLSSPPQPTTTSFQPSISPEKPTIVLDLDETLVHSKPDPPPENYHFVVRPVIDGTKADFYVLKRPFVDELLEFLSQKFEIVVFTAGLEEYASLVLDRLDRKRVIRHRLYRHSCREVDGKLVKDLGELGRDLRRVVIVDDNPNSYSLQTENAIPILPFTSDLCDGELRRLMEFFEGSDGFEDMRDAVKQYVAEGKQENKLSM